MLQKHTRVDGSEINSHIIDQDKLLPRFNPVQTSGKGQQGQAWFSLTGTSILRRNDGAARPLHLDAIDCLGATTSAILDQRKQKVHLLRLLGR